MDLTIKILAVEDSGFPPGGGGYFCTTNYCCWGGKGFVNTIGVEEDGPHLIR